MVQATIKKRSRGVDHQAEVAVRERTSALPGAGVSDAIATPALMQQAQAVAPRNNIRRSIDILVLRDFVSRQMA
jgi:hypothetical protein